MGFPTRWGPMPPVSVCVSGIRSDLLFLSHADTLFLFVGMCALSCFANVSMLYHVLGMVAMCLQVVIPPLYDTYNVV